MRFLYPLQLDEDADVDLGEATENFCAPCVGLAQELSSDLTNLLLVHFFISLLMNLFP